MLLHHPRLSGLHWVGLALGLGLGGMGSAAANGAAGMAAPPVALPVQVAIEGPYPLADALADALATPLSYVGKGAFYGSYRLLSCTYRNDRVVVIDTYCTNREQSSFGIIIVSPTRGRVTLHAEGRAAVSGLRHADYLYFRGRSEAVDPRYRPQLTWTLEEQSNYHQFGGRYLPFCDVEWRNQTTRGGCVKPLVEQNPGYQAQNAPFVSGPPPGWYQLVRTLLSLRQSPAITITAQNRSAWGQAFAAETGIALYSYHLDRLDNAQGYFAPIVATADGGLLLTGTTRQRPVVVRLDARGAVVWRRDLARKGFDAFEGGSAAATADGGFLLFILAYHDASRGGATRVVKLDASGRVQWDFVGRGTGGPDTPFADTLQQTAGGGVRLSGHIYIESHREPHRWSGELDAQGKLLRDEVGEILVEPSGPTKR